MPHATLTVYPKPFNKTTETLLSIKKEVDGFIGDSEPVHYKMTKCKVQGQSGYSFGLIVTFTGGEVVERVLGPFEQKKQTIKYFDSLISHVGVKVEQLKHYG